MRQAVEQAFDGVVPTGFARVAPEAGALEQHLSHQLSRDSLVLERRRR
jgi:hypothetical protein